MDMFIMDKGKTSTGPSCKRGLYGLLALGTVEKVVWWPWGPEMPSAVGK